MYAASQWNSRRARPSLQNGGRYDLAALISTVESSTSLAGTPAALCKLYPGDVISASIRMGKSAKSFPSCLGEQAAGNQVKFRSAGPFSDAFVRRRKLAVR